jgi:hypothetical protein
MINEPTSTLRARCLRERRSRGVVVVAPVEIGTGGIELLESIWLKNENLSVTSVLPRC